MSACSDVIDIVWTTLTTPPTVPILRSNLYAFTRYMYMKVKCGCMKY